MKQLAIPLCAVKHALSGWLFGSPCFFAFVKIICATMWLKLLKESVMSANAVVRARINESIKEEAAIVLAAMGMTVSDAFRMMLTRIAQDKALPFEPLIPNADTLAAMKEARAGKLPSFNNIDALMADLNADD